MSPASQAIVIDSSNATCLFRVSEKICHKLQIESLLFQHETFSCSYNIKLSEKCYPHEMLNAILKACIAS